MARQVRYIVRIDEDKCDGCGVCIPSCAEGAIQVVDGKARLVADKLCDGIGNCLGTCPKGAITLERREADAFDELAVGAQAKTTVKPQAKEKRSAQNMPAVAGAVAVPGPQESPLACGCPGTMARKLNPTQAASPASLSPVRSRLGHWPVQLHLLPIHGEIWDGADVLIAADCVGFAMPDFHERLLGGRTLAVGCPKLDDAASYVEKLTAVFAGNDIRSVTVAHMEVPCCTGLVTLVKEALAAAGRRGMAFRVLTVGIEGRVQEELCAGAR